MKIVYCPDCQDACGDCAVLLNTKNRRAWECDECDGLIIDEVGDAYCNVDGNLIEEMDNCPELEGE